MTMLEFSLFKPFSERIIHGVTTKEMGSFNYQSPIANDQFLRRSPQDSTESFGLITNTQLNKISSITNSYPIFSNQMHGDRVIFVEDKPQTPFEADAFITNKSGLTLVIKIADCQGILIFDPVKNVIGAVHAGWRSTALNIVEKTINRMSEEFGSEPSDLFAGISPSLGPCCAEFSDPESELPDFMHQFVRNRYVDLWSANIKQLTDAGVPENQIELYEECTKCNKDKYFSHRNGDTGRMAVFISLRHNEITR